MKLKILISPKCERQKLKSDLESRFKPKTTNIVFTRVIDKFDVTFDCRLYINFKSFIYEAILILHEHALIRFLQYTLQVI